MSFAGILVPALHLLISASRFQISDGSLSSLEMKDILFVTRRSRSTADLVQEFFNRTLLPSCDLTANLCDVNCCNDKDCDEDHLGAFSCTKGVEHFSRDPILSDPLYCHSNDLTYVDPVLCFEAENSPFLGVYFMEDRVLKRKWIETNADPMWAKRHFPLVKNVQPSRNKYVYGVPLRLTNKEVVHLPSDILGKGYCDYGAPVRFLADTESVCVSGASPERCANNPNLHLESYFQKGEDGFEPPEIYGGGAPVRGNLTVGCRHDTVDMEDFFVVHDMLRECGNASKIARAEYDTKGICRRVVTRVEYHFTWHENALVAFEVLATLSDIPMVPVGSVPSRRSRKAITQVFITKFHRQTDSKRLKHSSYRLNDEILLHHT